MLPEEDEVLLLLPRDEELPADCLEDVDDEALCPPEEVCGELLLDTEVEAGEDCREVLPLPTAAVLLRLLWLSDDVDCLVLVPSLRGALPVRLPWLTVEVDCLVPVPWLRVSLPAWLLWLTVEVDCLVVPSPGFAVPVRLLLTVDEELLVVVPEPAAVLPVRLPWVAVPVDWRVVPVVPVLLWDDLLVAVPAELVAGVPAWRVVVELLTVDLLSPDCDEEETDCLVVLPGFSFV